MPRSLPARLDRLEASIPTSAKPGRVISIVVNDGDDKEQLLAAHGYDPGNGDLAIIINLVGPGGESECPVYLEHD
jgi:hypothetical protein